MITAVKGFSRLKADQSIEEIIDEWLILLIYWMLKNDLSYIHSNSNISFNHSECVWFFFINVSHFINHFYPRHLSVSYSIPAFSLFSFFCLGIINIVFRNFIHLREIYLSLLVCFSICHLTVHCYLRLVNDYSKVRNTD